MSYEHTNEQYKGHTLKVVSDDDPESPRIDCDNFGTMVCWHRGYDLGDENDYANVSDFQEWWGEQDGVILELYLYDHSGITMSCAPFSCPWDSGQVGYIYATREQILKEYGGTRPTKGKREKARKLLAGEVETYDQYLTGDVWGYVVEHEASGWEDSCWGFYGSDYCEDEAKSSIDRHVAELRKEKIEQVKTWIRNKVPLYVRAAALA